MNSVPPIQKKDFLTLLHDFDNITNSGVLLTRKGGKLRHRTQLIHRNLSATKGRIISYVFLIESLPKGSGFADPKTLLKI